jgi:hypothetical protein
MRHRLPVEGRQAIGRIKCHLCRRHGTQRIGWLAV